MASSKQTYLRVGLLLVSGIALFGFAVFSLGRGSRLFASTEILRTHFHRINGLQAGAQVTLSGVTVGAVDAIRFPEDAGDDYVEVAVWVERNAARRIHADSLVQIKTLGLLGDKFVEISPGTPGEPIAKDFEVLRSQDPIDYESLLGQKGTGDFIANIMAASNSFREILDDVNKGNGILSQLIKGERSKSPVTLADVRDTIDHLNRASQQIEQLVGGINNGKGLAGTLLTDKPEGRKLLRDLSTSASSFRVTAERLDRLTARLDHAEGLGFKLLEDKQLGDELLGRIRESTSDLEQILRKINSGEGTAGKLVNDPSLYNGARNLIGGGGWGLSLLKGLYGLTHPFATVEPESPTACTGQPVEPGAAARPLMPAATLTSPKPQDDNPPSVDGDGNQQPADPPASAN